MQRNGTERNTDVVMSVRAAAVRLSQSPWHTRNLVAAGDLVGVQQVGDGYKRLLITESSVNALLAVRAEEASLLALVADA